MLIFPIEHKLDWKNPPVATLLLITINVLVFFLYQSGDEKKFNHAWETYEEAGLYERESSLVDKYILETDGSPLLEDEVIYVLILDKQFDYWLRDYWQREIISIKDLQNWRSQRNEVVSIRNEISHLKYGFIPAEPTFVTLFTSMFLHGGWGHLLGNMIFLFLFGFCLEIALGRIVFLLLYVLSGFAANGMHALTEIYFGGNGYISLVGASGAISGEMGMYLALFGAKRINFLYYFGFVFGHWRAPAIIIFPIWVGKEIVESLTLDSNIAYWAHIGGLLGGYMLVFSLKDRFFKVDDKYIDNVDETAYQKLQLEKINRLVSEMKVDRAKNLAQSILVDEPFRTDIYDKLFTLTKMNSDTPEFHRLALDIFKKAKYPEMSSDFIASIVQQYSELTVNPRALSGPVCLILCSRFLNANDVAAATSVMDRLLHLGYQNKHVPGLLLRLSNLHAKSHDRKKSDMYLNRIKTDYPDSHEAKVLIH